MHYAVRGMVVAQIRTPPRRMVPLRDEALIDAVCLKDYQMWSQLLVWTVITIVRVTCWERVLHTAMILFEGCEGTGGGDLVYIKT